MKKLLFALPVFIFAAAVFAQNAKPAPAAQAAAAPTAAQDDAAKAQEENAKTLYSLGYMMGNTVKNQLIIGNEDEFKYISQGMRDSMTNKPSQTDLDTYKPAVIKRYESDSKKINEKRAADNKKFLDNAKKDRNTKEIDSGILVQTLVKGKGAAPSVSSLVKVNYHGTLIDGTVFDSSVLRGTPAEFPLNQVIQCWTKGLQDVKAGGKVKLICPPETAYGSRAMGSIPPNSVLIFEVELLDVK
ncbi:MAG: FKBP-type peptidyl-prolyl cis-trans isomerase [Elusimicrobium sp.]|jgi:FKBP-type peptidyl-prolyl cis-trans isomerase|nr:FKBP-type peptidyl-prolyl cis-trans isomerase [Elusimicrobium sp.]